ncbi:MAG TPA: hypothetical protein VKF62_13695, partial [Planctomycetota bacterium]|nr:hypothetical protein [Planctomycetota bacterium]
SVNSYTRIFTGPGTMAFVDAAPPRRLRVGEDRVEAVRTAEWKRERASWGWLKGLWVALPR